MTPLLLATLIAAPQAVIQNPVITPTRPGIPIVFNEIANPGFETSPISAAWHDAGSYGDPYNEGDPDDFEPIWNGRTTSMHRSGGASFSFGTDYNLGQMYAYSAIGQSFKYPFKVASVVAASLYAWSPAGNWSPDTLEVEIDYTDAAPSYTSQEIINSENDQYGVGGGWRLVNFKSALRAGKTISAIVLSTTSYPYAHNPLWVDDVTLSVNGYLP